MFWVIINAVNRKKACAGEKVPALLRWIAAVLIYL